MLERHLMTPVLTVPSGTPIEIVARTLASCEGRQLPVMLEGRPIGVVRQEDVDDQGTLRDGAWFGWGPARTARDVTSDAPIVGVATLEDALRALLSDTVVLVCTGDGQLAGVLTEHDAVRIASEALPDGLQAVDLATRPALAVDVGDRACHAEQHMRGRGARHVVLTEGGKAVGVLSHRDLVAAGVAHGRGVSAAEVWRHRPLLAVSEHAPLREAVAVMLDERVGAVPLLDAAGHPVAVLTRRDLVRAAVERGWGA